MKKLLVVLLVLGFVAPAMAADWNFYGSARMATFYVTEDVGDLEDAGLAFDDAGLDHSLQGNSRIGATVKASDQIGGAFEYSTGVSVRKLYGTYNFGGGELLVGQTYTPTSNYFYSNSVFAADGDLLGIGQFYAGRRPMVQLTMGSFKVALVTPVAGTATLGTYTDADISLPKLELSYGFKSDAFFVDVFGGYQTYDLEDNAADDTKSITAYTLGAGAGMMFGPATISIGANIGQNYTSYGASVGFDGRDIAGTFGIEDVAAPALVDGDVEDTSALQALLVANFKTSDTLAFEVGVGFSSYTNSERSDAAGLDEDTYTQMQYYGNAVVTIAPGFFIVPEIGFINYGEFLDGDTDLGTDTYVGLKWQINF